MNILVKLKIKRLVSKNLYPPSLLPARTASAARINNVVYTPVCVLPAYAQVVYSAMHGVGDAWARRAFHAFSLPPLISVESQRYPDPEFSTVPYPNPEEQGTLKEAMILAEERGEVVAVIAGTIRLSGCGVMECTPFNVLRLMDTVCTELSERLGSVFDVFICRLCA